MSLTCPYCEQPQMILPELVNQPVLCCYCVKPFYADSENLASPLKLGDQPPAVDELGAIEITEPAEELGPDWPLIIRIQVAVIVVLLGLIYYFS